MVDRNTAISLGTALLLITSASFAADKNRQNFHAGSNINLEQIPPGLLRSGLRDLPPQARARALEWLDGFSFPAADVARLRVDSNGAVFYVDEFAYEVEAISSAEVDAPSGITPAETFSLHSKPGAATVLFIDVDGHVISNTAWNNGSVDPLYAQAFDSDGDGASFSPTELDQIAEMWYRIAEDYSSFDVDVTTEDPGVFGRNTGRVLITPNVDANGVPMPAQNAGGVAYVNVFGLSNYGYYSPALVYSNNLSNHPPFIAEAASHEAGHNLGLSHDGTSTRSYYSGHGTGAVSWGPIMGTGYNDNVSQWSMGEYADANNFQDDISIITSKMGQRPDDHSDSFSAATTLQVGDDGNINSTTPQTDPFNTLYENKGVISSRTDEDIFVFSAGDGPANITVTPSWAAWLRNSNRGTNLDVEATLYAADGTILVRAEPANETNAVISTTLVAGDYYLGITGVGNSISPYTDYGSQGQYFISGNIVVGSSEPPPSDITPPTPNPMSFVSAPEANSDTTVTMTATTAVDESGSAVQYLFSSSSAGSSGWSGNTIYTATGLEANTTYSWQVKARDAAGNETNWSALASATTLPTPTEPEPPAAVTLSVVDNADGSATLSWNDVASELTYQVYRETWHSKRNRWRANTLIATLGENTVSYTNTGVSGQVRYLVRSVNNAGNASSTWVEVNVTNASDGGNGGCKGGPKKCGTS